MSNDPAGIGPGPGLTFVIGGARSGKSRIAEGLVTSLPAPWRYIATAEALDDEMAERIARHKSDRGPGWENAEVPLAIAEALLATPACRPVLVDCLTLWLSNVMHAGRDPEAESDRLIEVLGQPRGPWVVVSNEVGLGIVPESALARRFRDHAGRLNQRVAAAADRVILTVAGLSHRLK